MTDEHREFLEQIDSGRCPNCGSNITEAAEGFSFICLSDDCTWWIKKEDVENKRRWLEEEKKEKEYRYKSDDPLQTCGYPIQCKHPFCICPRETKEENDEE